MSRVHLYESKVGLRGCAYRAQCGFVAGLWEVERIETINPNNVTCLKCRGSKRWKELMELDKQVSEIKEIEGEAMADFKKVERLMFKSCNGCGNNMGDGCKITGRIEFDENGQCSDHTQKVKHPAFDEPLNAHYKTGGIQTVDKIETIIGHLKGKVNLDQACQIYNALKYYDRCENKGSLEKDLFKSADSICRAITGKFINEES